MVCELCLNENKEVLICELCGNECCEICYNYCNCGYLVCPECNLGECCKYCEDER